MPFGAQANGFVFHREDGSVLGLSSRSAARSRARAAEACHPSLCFIRFDILLAVALAKAVPTRLLS